MTAPLYGTVSLDVDSTLAGVEGIDWLAARRGATVAAEVHALTERAMLGEVSLDSVYGLRLAMVRPSRADIEALGGAYLHALAPGAADCVRALREVGVRVIIVSGGVRQALLPLGDRLGVSPEDVFGVPLVFTSDGEYAGFDEMSPLARAGGKRVLLERLAGDLPRPLLHVGDGATDLEVVAEPVGGEFHLAAFTGFAHRSAVVAGAQHVVRDFAELQELVTGSQ